MHKTFLFKSYFFLIFLTLRFVDKVPQRKREEKKTWKKKDEKVNKNKKYTRTRLKNTKSGMCAVQPDFS